LKREYYYRLVTNNIQVGYNFVTNKFDYRYKCVAIFFEQLMQPSTSKTLRDPLQGRGEEVDQCRDT
jgi:hypothetical protein